MRSRRRLALLALVLVTGCGGGSKTTSGQLGSIGAGLKAPAGYSASLYASGLAKMSAFAFDSGGRLWVATADYSSHAKDGVYLVRKAGARPVKVISGLDTPLGLAWYRGQLYVASLGRVDAFGDMHGNRFGARRTVLRGPVAGGENNNLVIGPGGEITMGVSASCDHCTPRSKWSGAVVSFRPDGSHLRLYAGGIRAPIGLAFRPGTHDLFVTMNQRDDLGKRTPGDWLALVRRGQNWRFPDCYGQCADAPKPTAVLEPHAAVGGVAIAGNNALVAEWQLGSVWEVGLADGSARKLVTGFRNPLPLVYTADGSLLAGDWGTGRIYKIAHG